jgi:hypothetical protein
MSGAPCHGCPDGKATIRERRGDRLAFCTKDCQRAFYGLAIAQKADISAEAKTVSESDANTLDSIGYGLFGVIRGPANDPDRVPENMRSFFTLIIKGAMDEARARGEGPLLAAMVAENLEMMFLPADANDPGFTDAQREFVFGYLFMPGKAKGLRTVMGVQDIKEFKQHVLAVAVRRGFLNTARYLVEHMRGQIWQIFEEGAESPRLFFQMLGSVPMARRRPMLRWLVSVMEGENLKGYNARWVLMYLTAEVVATDDMELYARIAPYVYLQNSAYFLLRRAVAESAIHTARIVLDTVKDGYSFIEAEILLLESLRVHPYTKAAQDMTTLLLERLRRFLSNQVSPNTMLHAAMQVGRPDVFEAIMGLYPISGISSDVRTWIINAAAHGDHEFIRIYARYELSPDRAGNVAFSLLIDLAGRMEDPHGVDRDELWADADELIANRPPDIWSLPIAQARDSMSTKVLAGLIGKMPFFWTLMRSVDNNDTDLLRTLVRLAPAVEQWISANGRRMMVNRAISKGSLRSLTVLQEEFQFPREHIQDAAIMFAESVGVALDVIQMTGADAADMSRMLTDLSLMIAHEAAPGSERRGRQIMLGVLDRYPHLVWERWDENHAQYEAAGFHDAALAFQSRRQRQEEGRKAARHVERRVVL